MRAHKPRTNRGEMNAVLEFRLPGWMKSRFQEAADRAHLHVAEFARRAMSAACEKPELVKGAPPKARG